MKERFLWVKDVWKKRKVMAVGAVALMLFVVALVVMPRFFTEVGAGETTFDTARVISSGTTVVKPGEYYKITGTNSQNFTLSYDGDFSSEPAYIILDNATFQLNSDISALTFVGQEISEEASSFEGNFVVYIKGTNLIQSNVAGAKSALIEAENMKYTVKSYDRYSPHTQDEMKFKTYDVSRTSKVIFKGNGSADDCLKLITASGSYGAAIGSSEIATMGEGITYKAGQGQHYVVVDGVTYKHGQEVFTGNLKCGSATLDIQSGANIIIEGNGHGAGIGSGASVDSVISFKGDKNLNTTNIQTANASAVMDASNTTISGGTVVVRMGDGLKACGIGTGTIAGEGTELGTTVIVGGSVNVQVGENAVDIAKPVNGEGKEVFPYILNVDKAVGTDGVIQNGESTKLIDVVGGDQDYYAKYTGSDAGINDKLNFTVDVDEPAADYLFSGYATQHFEYLGENHLTFYLPTQILVTYTLQVDGDLDMITYSYQENADGYNDLQAGAPIRAKEKRNMSIRLNNVPEFCTQITYQTSANESGTINKNAAGDYVYSFTMPSKDYRIYFKYDIGKYNIQYDMGGTDANITNPNPSNYVCGETVVLQEPTWEGHTFVGWYTDSGLTQPIEEVMSTTVDDTIVVYAKWTCKVEFVDDEGNVLYDTVVDYGTSFLEGDYPANPEDTSEKAFLGWEIDGTLYEVGNRPQFVVLENTVVKGIYEAVGYFVYVNATFTNQEGVTSLIDLERAGIFEMYFHGSPIAFEGPTTENLYYKTVNFADRTDITTGKATAKNGYKLAGIEVKDAAGNNLELFSTMDDQYAFSFMMPDKDVYITVNFQNPDYKITYYNYDKDSSMFTEIVPVETEGNPNVYEFNATTPEVILNDAPSRSKYERFVGWYVFGDVSETTIHTIPTGAYSSDIALVAIWEDVDTYPIIIDETIKEWVSVYDADGVEVEIGIPGEKLTMIVTPGRGITFEDVTYGYVDSDGGIYKNTKTPSPDMTSPYTYTFAMPGYKTEITGTFTLTEYTITYLGLLGAENSNPATYNVKSVIELQDPKKAGYVFEEWRIVLPDTELGYESTKEFPIEIIEDRIGNIVLVAIWKDTPGAIENHKIHVLDGITNGTVSPYVNEAIKEQYVFVSISPERGYRLSKMYYYPLEENKVLQSRLNTDRTAFEVPLVEVSEGIYYFIMPDNGIELMAEFEAISYKISYINGLNAENPSSYTIESDIVLKNPVREGYEFLGWYDDEGNKVSRITNIIGNLSLTAKWKEIILPEKPDEPESPSKPTEKPDKDDGFVSQIGQIIQNNKNPNSSEDMDSSDSGAIRDQLMTGDEANIGHLVVICIICLVIALVAFPKKKRDDKDELSE